MRENKGRRFDLESTSLGRRLFFLFRFRSQLAATAATSFFLSPCSRSLFSLSEKPPPHKNTITTSSSSSPSSSTSSSSYSSTETTSKKKQVGVGTATSKEVVDAVQKAVIAAKKEMVTVPLTRGATFPHRVDGVFGAARVMLRPASEGTGVIAGGAVRVVLELAGVKNAFGKQLGSGNPLNNARAAVEGLRLQRTVEMVAKERGLTVAQMLQHKPA